MSAVSSSAAAVSRPPTAPARRLAWLLLALSSAPVAAWVAAPALRPQRASTRSLAPCSRWASAQFTGGSRAPVAASRGRTRATARNLDGGADDGVREGPDWLVRERDACGVGFVVGAPAEGATHSVISRALGALGCMEHRGACGGDDISGDGAGVMTDIPWGLIEADMALGDDAPPRARRGVVQLFLPRDPAAAERAYDKIAAALEAGGMDVLGKRVLPVDAEILGPLAAAVCPTMQQLVFASKDPALEGDALENQLYVLRRSMPAIEGVELAADQGDGAYVVSLSSRTIIYKGMLQSCALARYYLDLLDERYETRFAIYHRRFSTNTQPRWPLAQPFRILGHNGEINTLLGNINWASARANAMPTCPPGDDPAAMGDALRCDVRLGMLGGPATPLVDGRKSDSANLDAVFESFVRGGMLPTEALMTLVPEAYKKNPVLAESSPDVESFYEYHAPMQEAWDGPALLVYSDGKSVGAQLDRNGLRPARYARLADGTVYIMSETGVVPWDEADVVDKGRLGPGGGIVVGLDDTWLVKKGECLTNSELKAAVSAKKPYGQRLADARPPIKATATSGAREFASNGDVARMQTAFGWGSEDVEIQIEALASGGVEATYCMGDDAPLAVLSPLPHVLYDYFKQRFAQVTNPAIDPLREGSVMSLDVALGVRPDPLDEDAGAAAFVRLSSPLMNADQIAEVSQQLPTARLSTRYDATTTSLRQALNRLKSEAVAAVMADTLEDSAGTPPINVLVLSDRVATDAGDLAAVYAAGGGAEDEATVLSQGEAYVPTLLAVGAVHHALIRANARLRCSIVAETAQAWSTHHFATLLTYGCNAVRPYMAHEATRLWRENPKVQALIESGKQADVTVEGALNNYKVGVEKGIKKILAKIGISCLSSYTGAQVMEAIGIHGELIDEAFVGTPSRIGGMKLEDVELEMAAFIAKVEKVKVDDDPTAPAPKLENYGLVKPMPRKEYHHNTPQLAKLLHKAIRDGPGGVDQYELFSRSLSEAPVTSLRDLLELRSDREPIPLDEVEPAEAIMERFCTGGMSLGALSREAHECLAIAMNRIGGRSNSGEGGEDPARDEPVTDVADGDTEGRSAAWPHLKGLKNGDVAASKIRQLASGRFGVTTPYLVNARQLEIKLAQGAKPGEGGQLPGKKVDAYIAGLRASTPGVTLISPPPHHDIYSIEDLAQLIYDIKSVNKEAPVSVKLVASVGIGTVACGVAKAQADVIQISGFDGGTGASPLSSIKHAGGPWEIGLSESHRQLVDSGLRSRVALRVDGGIRTGMDVLIGAALGGQEFGFGTIAMIAEGCIMARVCHTNQCPAGIATQQASLRARFPGTPEHVVNYFAHVAEEVRGLLASLGYRSIGEVIGRQSLVVATEAQAAKVTKTQGVTTSFVTAQPDSERDDATMAEERAWNVHKSNAENIQSIGEHHDDRLLANHPDLAAVVARGGPGAGDVLVVRDDVNNLDRAAFARLAGDLVRAREAAGERNAALVGDAFGEVRFDLTGTGGQSFGAFIVDGMHIALSGESNDYVGKGMAGGLISIAPQPSHGFVAADASIVGNTCLYGATSGTLLAAGRAGERFCVRNSGARAVIEGVGDHAMEYMTGGVLVVLGPAGRNIGAGFTGGLGYFLDIYGDATHAADGTPPPISDGFHRRLNDGGTFKIQRVKTARGAAQLRGLIEEHFAATGSERARELLADWETRCAFAAPVRRACADVVTDARFLAPRAPPPPPPPRVGARSLGRFVQVYPDAEAAKPEVGAIEPEVATLEATISTNVPKAAPAALSR